MPSPRELTADRFVQLVVRHEWRVRAFAATILGRPQNFEDVVQDVFTVAWAKREQFRYEGDEPDEEFVRWVCTICRYEALKDRRKSSLGVLLDDSVIERLVSVQFEESLYLEARRRALSNCIEKLAETDRLLIRRRYSGEQSVEEIATADGRTTSAIYKALDRIRASLLACVSRTMSQEGY